MASADSQLTKKTALLGNLSTQYDRTIQDLEATRNQLQQVRAEYAKLMASIDDAGLVYMNGTLQFNDAASKIVSDFWEGARMQDIVIPNMNAKAIKPSDLFAFLSERSQRYAHGLKMYQQRQSASFLEGNTSMNDAALQDSEIELGSLIVRPGAN